MKAHDFEELSSYEMHAHAQTRVNINVMTSTICRRAMKLSVYGLRTDLKVTHTTYLRTPFIGHMYEYLEM